MRRRYFLAAVWEFAGVACASRVPDDAASTSQTEASGTDASGTDDSGTDTSGTDEGELGEETEGEVCELDCENPVEVAEGIVKCESGKYNRIHGGTFEPTVSGPGCMGDEDIIECMTDAECNSGKYGKCIHGGGIIGVETWCRCEYSCSSDDDCAEGSLCLPPFGEFGPPYWPICVPASCEGPDDCECGQCGVGSFSICSTYFTLACRTMDDYCGGGPNYCVLGSCYPTPEGPWGCRFIPCRP